MPVAMQMMLRCGRVGGRRRGVEGCCEKSARAVNHAPRMVPAVVKSGAAVAVMPQGHSAPPLTPWSCRPCSRHRRHWCLQLLKHCVALSLSTRAYVRIGVSKEARQGEQRRRWTHIGSSSGDRVRVLSLLPSVGRIQSLSRTVRGTDLQKRSLHRCVGASARDC